MGTYHQLTERQRYQMYALKKAGHTQQHIAATGAVSPSTSALTSARPSSRQKAARRWEIDLVMGRQRKGALVSLVERHSRYTVLGKVSKQAQYVAAVTIELLKPHKGILRRFPRIHPRRRR